MLNAFGALAQGTRLVLSPGLRRYVFLPVVANLALYVGTIVYLLNNFGGWLDYWMLNDRVANGLDDTELVWRVGFSTGF